MTLAALLGELQYRSIRLDPQGGDLRCRAPKGALTPELRRSIAENKEALLSLFRVSSQDGCGEVGGSAVSDDAPQVAGSARLSLHRLFEVQAHRAPDAIAIVSETEHVSYGELERRATRLSHYLRTLGVRQEVAVGIYYDLSIDSLVALLAVLRAGGACLPLDPEEPTETAPEPFGVGFCLVEKNRTGKLSAESVKLVRLGSPPEAPAAGDGTAPLEETRGYHVAYVLSTSGTGGERKWVQLEHRALVNVSTGLAWELGVGEDDVVFADAPLCSDRATLTTWLALVSGARLALARPDAPPATALARSRATLVVDTPSLWRRLLAAGWLGDPRIRLVSSGEVLDPVLAGRLENRSAGLWNLYGCVETSHVSAMRRFHPRNGGVAVSPAVATRLYVLDEELQPTPIEVAGDLYVGGSPIARGYANGPESTAENFVPDPFAGDDGVRLFRTGDRARWHSDGTLQVLGRADEFRHLGGARAEPRLVEDILRHHPQVKDVAASLQRRGENNGSSLNAYVVPETQDRALIASLSQFLRVKVPPHLVPSAIYPLPELPLTRRGRLDRSALRELGELDAVPRARVVTRKLPGEDLDQLCERTNLTKNQLLVWMGQKLQPDAPLYNIATLFTIEGPVERLHLEKAFQALVDASDALRTVIAEEDGIPRQRVLPRLHIEMEYKDLSVSPHPQRLLERWARRRSQVPFELTERLFYSGLIKLSEREYAWYLIQHHIITDAWSVALVYRQVEALYRQSVSGELKDPPALPAFADFVTFERQKRETEPYRRAQEYWRTKLAEDAEPVEFYGSDVPKRTTRVDRVAYELGTERSESVKTLAQQKIFSGSSENLSAFVLFATVLCTHLHRISGNRLLSVGTTILNRPSRKFKETIGLFMQVAPLRIEISDLETFGSLAGKIKTEMRESMRYQRYATGNSPQHKVYDVLLNYETASGRHAFHHFPARVKSYKSRAMDSLAVLVRDYGKFGSYGLDFDYHCDLFSPEEQRQTWNHFQRVLESLLEDPDRLLSEVSLLSGEERQQLLLEFNRSGACREFPTTMLQLFEAQVDGSPDSVALVFEEGQLSYAELNRRANILGYHLRELGVRPEVNVGVCLPRSLDLVVGVLGVLKSGGAYVPIDPALAQQRREFILRDARVAVVVTNQKLEEKQPLRVAAVHLESLEVASPQGTQNPSHGATSENSAYIIYTSGSTGRPKGVMVTHRNLANAYLGWEKAYDLGSDRLAHLQMASFSFDVFAGDLVRGLLSGGRLVICPQALLLEPSELYDLMRRERIQIAEFVPVVLRSLVQHARTSGHLGFMRTLIVGSDTWYVGEHEDTKLLCGSGTRFVQSYGVTEATIDSTFFEGDVDRGLPPESLLPIGRPFSGVKIHILDWHGHPAPLGIHGELCIGGEGVARGYLERPGLTAEKFVPDPFGDLPGCRLYRTGDLARYHHDGTIRFLGRKDLQIKLRGFRVELGEIEAALVQHPEISNAVVVAREEGSGVKRLVAYLVPEADATLTIAELRSHLKEQLADYMLPSAYVALDALPLTPSGKVDRQALPIPDPSQLGSGRAYVAPGTPREKELARIWSEVLGVERVGLYDDFFELGGHSLMAIQLVSRVREAFGLELPLARLLENPSVAGFAELVEASLGSGQEGVFDLASEAALEPDIGAGGRSYKPVDQPAAIFLTGASGFLGAFLLRDLLEQTKAEVYCLVRATSSDEGKAKLRENLRRYSLWEESLGSRVVPVPGDLSSPRLGLSVEDFGALARKIDVVYHNGAWIHALYPYSALKATNVSGTHEVLRLASESRLKPVHHVSTISVFPMTGHPSGHVLSEQDVLDDQRPVNGYSQSKWVAEKLVARARSRGLPVTIYRPGLITGDSRTGASNRDDIAFKLLKACLEIGSTPILPPVTLTITPVDYVSEALVYLSQRKESLGEIFHLVNPEPIELATLLESIRHWGYPLRRARYDQWRAELLRLAESPEWTDLRPLAFLFGGDPDRAEAVGLEIPGIDFQNALIGLKGSSIRCARADRKLLDTYFSYFVRSGDLPSPVGSGRAGDSNPSAGRHA